MIMKTNIVLHDVYFDVTYPEYFLVRNRYYKNPTSFQCFHKPPMFQNPNLMDEWLDFGILSILYKFKKTK
jgi:hypothetical protein